MDERSERLRATVRTRRGELGLTQAEAADRGGVPLPTWEAVEQGKTSRPKARTLAGIDRALGWSPGTALATLNDLQLTPGTDSLPADRCMVAGTVTAFDTIDGDDDGDVVSRWTVQGVAGHWSVVLQGPQPVVVGSDVSLIVRWRPD